MLARPILATTMIAALAACARAQTVSPANPSASQSSAAVQQTAAQHAAAQQSVAPSRTGGARLRDRSNGNWRPPSIPSSTTGPSNAAARSVIQTSGTSPVSTSGAAAAPRSATAGAAPAAPRQPITRVTQGTGELPKDHGQVWRDYDISPYTVRVTTTNRPEQAIVDWILRETGYEAWHSEPLGLLSANQRVLRVYHTPQMHAVVADVVDRFLNTEADSCAFSLGVVTVGHPNWRAKAQTMLHPVTVQTQGIQAWLIHKEDAALLMAELRKRSDFREHSSPHLLVNNGQATTVSSTRPRTYIRDVTLRPDVWPAFQPEPAQFDEGFALELSPLLSLDGRTIDAVIKCNVDQLEKLVPVMIEVPTPIAPHQRTKIEVPQVTHCRLHERFRWPADQILLVGLGVVATPVPTDPNPIKVALPFVSGPERADLLVFVESKGRIGSAPAAANAAPVAREAKTYHGRY